MKQRPAMWFNKAIPVVAGIASPILLQYLSTLLGFQSLNWTIYREVFLLGYVASPKSKIPVWGIKRLETLSVLSRTFWATSQSWTVGCKQKKSYREGKKKVFAFILLVPLYKIPCNTVWCCQLQDLYKTASFWTRIMHQTKLLLHII